MSSPHDASVKSLAVSMSGGGHRATLFVLGALMYLVDVKANAFVTSIASVSGGSITNGLVGQNLDFRQTNGDEFRSRVASPLATQIARHGTLFAPVFSKVYIAILIVVGLLVLAILIPPLVPVHWLVRYGLFLIGLTVWGWILAARGNVCASAFNSTLFSPNGRGTKLWQIKKDNLDHVICSTEFRSQEAVYFAGDFVYSYALGHGGPGELPLAKAVQASAAFPGGFPPSTLPTKDHNFTGAPSPKDGGPPYPPAEMVLTDGGVYDNMGDQWARGLAKRFGACDKLRPGRDVPDRLVVVNASARVPWIPFSRRRLPLVGELMAIVRVLDVMYINTTNVRRQDIVASYNPLDPSKTTGLPTVLVQISQSPFKVAKFFAKFTEPAAIRAQEVLKLLGPTEDEWEKMADDNSAVGTSLSKFKPEVVARLIYQGYVVTMCNLHVFFDDFPLVPDALSIDRFRTLIK